MKRVAGVIVMVGLATFIFAQQPATGTPSQPNAKPAATAQGAAQSPAPGKRPPQAKTQPEYDDFKAAMASTQDPAATEKAANDFATKYPDSELRGLLYQAAMRAYQSANNPDKMLEMGRKVLTLDPDQPEALLGVSEVLVERTRDSDLDKDQRLAEATKDAQHALETVDTDIVVPADTPQEKVDAYKAFLRSNAYSYLGALEFNKENYPEAEKYFNKSVDALPSQPDPIVVLRLALALDRQAKYPDALKQANRAVELTQDNTTAGSLARRERDRLAQLTGGTKAPAGQNSAPPKN